LPSSSKNEKGFNVLRHCRKKQKVFLKCRNLKKIATFYVYLYGASKNLDHFLYVFVELKKFLLLI